MWARRWGGSERTKSGILTSTPSLVHWNVAIQRQLSPTITVDVGYVGSHGYHLQRITAANIRIPQILPDGSRQTNGRYGEAGSFGYRGPCPPVGVSHHYVFELFALDKKLENPAGSTRADLFQAMDGHILAHAVRVSVFR